MFGRHFYHSHIKKYTALFGTLFNNIVIERVDSDGTKVQTFQVPIQYGPREKWLSRVESDPDFNMAISQQMPMIIFEMSEVSYEEGRKLNTMNRFVQKSQINNKSVYDKVYQSVPITITYKMYIVGKIASDVHKIFEQIRPYFTPAWTVTANLIDEMPDLSLDIPIHLNSQEYKEEWHDNYKDRRACIWELEFNLLGHMFGPKTSAKIIKIAAVDLYADGVDGKFPGATIRIDARPGLTANGEPTSDPDESISPYLIEENDTYGYIVEITEKL